MVVAETRDADILFDTEAVANNQNSDDQILSSKLFREFAHEQLDKILPFFEDYETNAVCLKLQAIIREVGKMRKKDVQSFLEYEEKRKGKQSLSGQIAPNKTSEARRKIPAKNGKTQAKKGPPFKTLPKIPWQINQKERGHIIWLKTKPITNSINSFSTYNLNLF